MIQGLKNYLWHLPKAVFFSAWYRFPARKLTIIGVTGTKGKTTTAHMIYHLLRLAHLRSNLRGAKVRPGGAGLISTIGAFFGEAEIDTGLHVTSPDPRELQRLLRMAVDKGLTHMVLEVTSSGLDQFRIWGIRFEVAVITNIYPDHLDYHRRMEKYVSAKAKIIDQTETVILPTGLPYFHRQNTAASRKRVIFFETGESIISANKAATMAVGEFLGMPEAEVIAALREFKGVKGRLDEVYKNKFSVVIDFAHTPESLAAALSELRTRAGRNGRLIAVFGCAGERDPGRRKMGAVAAKLADYFIVTSEDPRSESPPQIASQILFSAKSAGAKPNQYEVVLDRQRAIDLAIAIAREGDVVGLFGKGHEASMCFGKVETPWSEYQAVASALKKRKLA